MLNTRAIALRGVVALDKSKAIALHGFYVLLTSTAIGRRIAARMPNHFQMGAPRWITTSRKL